RADRHVLDLNEALHQDRADVHAASKRVARHKSDYVGVEAGKGGTHYAVGQFRSGNAHFRISASEDVIPRSAICTGVHQDINSGTQFHTEGTIGSGINLLSYPRIANPLDQNVVR